MDEQKTSLISSRPTSFLVIITLAVTTLACNSFIDSWLVSDSNDTINIARLPTFTPTSLPASLLESPSAASELPQADTQLSDTTQEGLSTNTEAEGLQNNDNLSPTATSMPPASSYTEEAQPENRAVPNPPQIAQPAPGVNNPAPVVVMPPSIVSDKYSPSSENSNSDNANIIIPTVTPIPETTGWSFTSIRSYSDQYAGGVILYGLLVNNTGSPQRVSYLTGTFYDGQGQIIADQLDTVEYWPIDIVPSGEGIPFELAVNGLNNAADFELWAKSEISSQSPSLDFNITGIDQWGEDELYCLAGEVENSGNQVDDHIAVVATLYDADGNVVNFGEDYIAEPDDEELLEFEICIDQPNANVSRHELKAWGL